MNRLLRSTTFQAFVLLLVSCAKDASPPVPASIPTRVAAQPAGSYVSAVDDASGRPSFMWATTRQPAPVGATVESAARYHLARMAPAYAASGELARTATVKFVHDIGEGAKIVALEQRVDGIEIYPATVKVLMRPNLELVAISGSLHAPVVSRAGFKLSAVDALAVALGDHFGVAMAGSDARVTGKAEGGYDQVSLVHAPGRLQLDQPARVKRVFFAGDASLAPAYFVEFIGSVGPGVSSDGYRYIVAAADGRVLERANLSADAAFNYRVWADPTGLKRPFDGPQQDYTPHPTGIPDNSDPAFAPPNLVSMEAFNVNPNGVGDPWLGSGATQTFGNNVDAYSDVLPPDGFSNGDLRATTTGTRAFDRTYDVTHHPTDSADQQMAAITQLFYVTNWLHDYWYGSGFNEAAGNAQLQNFGRGGIGGDVLHAEAQDNATFLLATAGGRNNANMLTPADGGSPRMQMFVFNGPEVRSLTLQPLNISLNNDTCQTPIAFGPHIYDITAEVVLSDDGVGTSHTDGCNPLVNDVAGKVVLIDRAGQCANIAQKVRTAQNAGAIGALVMNSVPTGTTSMSGVDPLITIGAIGISQADGNALKAALLAGPVTAHLVRQGQPDRDGAIDNMVVSHEWGHYLHHRLADPCSTNQCRGTSEGWGDFTALQLILREGDNLDGTFANGVYAPRQFQDSAYYGIRRFPYSVDHTKSPLTFRYIADGVPLPDGAALAFAANNAEAHQTGEIWAGMLFEAYIALQKQTLQPGATRTFAQTQRIMANYVVAGLELMPPDATFTEERDAILAAISASSQDDLATVAAAFARRGLGSCAVSPDRNSTNNQGLVESFDLKPRLAIADIHVDDGTLACDTDGVLDVGETGRIIVQVVNGSAVASTGVDVTLANPSAALIPSGATTVHVPSVPPFGTATATFEVTLDPAATGVQDLHFDVTASDPNACTTAVTVAGAARVNSDSVPVSSKTDDVEADVTPWTVDNGTAWTRQADDPAHHHWHGDDVGSTSDVRLVSPAMQVSATDPFVITFKHRYQFETSGAGASSTFFDGGVIEYSIDDGHTWQDVSTLTTPGYGGNLVAGGTNVLNGKPAYVNKNATNPLYDTVTLDFGPQLASKSVRVRFRAVSDEGAGAAGWDIDDIAVSGIDNTPFATLVTDQPSVCPTAPTAVAGADQVVPSGALVALDASQSSDANGDALHFAWTQTAGPTVTINGANGAIAAFHAPVVAVATTFSFQVAVSDASQTSTDSENVVVLPPPLPDAGIPDAGAPDASPPDASPPDASPPDASPDAAMPAPDASPIDASPIDASPDAKPDAMPVTAPDAGHIDTGGGGGCGCSVGASSDSPSRGALGGSFALLGLGAIVALRRRRR